MNIKDLNADVLKARFLGYNYITMGRKTYHNKHKNGSGNFGFILRVNNKDLTAIHLDGEYNTSGEITRLRISKNWRMFRDIQDDIRTIQELCVYVNQTAKRILEEN